jgi:ABC-type iron transport system FetAB ATPase subunit
MRTKSILKVVDKITMTSNFVDDIEFLGSLDNLGLGYNTLNKVLTYVRKHDEGSITEEGKKINGVNLWDDILRVRDEVDFLRPNGTEFTSNIIEIKVPYNYSTQIDSKMKERFANLLSNIDNILKPTPTFKDKFDWRRF